MNTKHVLAIAIAASLAMLAQVSFAQSTSRDDVKAQTRAAEAAGTIMPPGEGYAPENTPKASPSSKTRAQEKAETRAAQKSGELGVTNERSVVKIPKTTSTTSRAAVKAETRAAEKAGTLTPSGEATPGIPQK